MYPDGHARRRVLIIDDEHVIADTLAVILANAGFQTWACYSGEDALGVARDIAPDAVISDVVMHGINGVQTAMRILQDWPQCRIILFSGQAATKDFINEARSRGYEFNVLSKPLHPSALIKILNQVLPQPEKPPETQPEPPLAPAAEQQAESSAEQKTGPKD